MSISSAALIFALQGCATQDEVKALETRVADLEKKVADGAKAGPRTGQAKADPKAEEGARELYASIQEAIGKGNFDEAKAKMATLEKDFSDTTVARRAKSTKAELDVIGKEAPKDLEIEKWFQGEDQVDIASGKPTLLVFWEVWCPHCKREVPKLQETYNKYNSKGLQMVGVTKITKSSTEEKVTEFMSEEKVGYPVAKETGSLSQHFAVRGIPAAAVVKDGKVVWRGHPARLNDDMIEGWL